MAVTKRKISYYDTKTIEELRNIPNSFIPAIQTNVNNYKIPTESFFNTFPTKTELYTNFPTKTEVYNNFPTKDEVYSIFITKTDAYQYFPTKTELYTNYPTRHEMYDAISRLSANGIAWIYDNGNAYTDTINALNAKKLPVFVYESSGGSGSGTSTYNMSSGGSGGSGSSATYTGLAYIKNIDDYGIHFYSLINTNAEFTEYYIKTNNIVETTDCKNVDSSILLESVDPNFYNKINDAINYGQSIICKSGNKFMPLAEVSAQGFNSVYCFRRDSLHEHGFWCIDNLNNWIFIQDH